MLVETRFVDDLRIFFCGDESLFYKAHRATSQVEK